jgi:hypothetical protein
MIGISVIAKLFPRPEYELPATITRPEIARTGEVARRRRIELLLIGALGLRMPLD